MNTKLIPLDLETKRRVNQWLDGNYDEETKEHIRKALVENPQEIIDAFYTTLSFGTGGLRGMMGFGSNRMNKYTVKAATQGLANYILKQPAQYNGFSVFIGYDSRHNSKFFAEESAKVLAGNGITVYLCADIRPTPLVSFGCRYKKCSAAIMITASHNPAEYNGYKVYWNDGAQVLPPHDKNIIHEVSNITDISMINEIPCLPSPLVHMIYNEIDEAYVRAITPLQNYPEENLKYGKSLKVVYSPLHGTGITMIPQTLAAWGFTNLTVVQEQAQPDGSFPTVKSPNPEEKSALKLGTHLLEQTKSDLFIATDPDADRVGVVVIQNNEPFILNGNQIACLCLEHVCYALASQKRLPENAAFVKTLVTTELFQAIASAYHRPCFNTLTGFKYIAECIRHWEVDPKGYRYIFGGEESYGYLLGTNTRDKDAAIASALICETALHCKLQGKTLIDMLYDLYKKYGVYEEKLLSVNFPETKEGKELMARSIEKLQSAPPHQILGIPVLSLEDYKTGVKKYFDSGKTEPLPLPQSDLLLFWLQDGSKVMVRSSGTEPKIKLYCGVVEKNIKSIPEAMLFCQKKASDLLEAMKGFSDTSQWTLPK